MSRRETKKREVGEMSLLVNGLSFSSLDVGSIKDAIRKLDARLEENTASLQESWGNFVDICNTIPNDKKNSTEWLNSKDAVDLLTSSSVTQANMCSSDPIALNCFLNNVIQALERNPGQEELIFHDLVQFASQQGIVLPFGRPAKHSGEEQTTDLQLNTVVIEDEQATDLLWEGIRNKIRRGIWAMLGEIPLACDQNSNPGQDQRKIDLLNDLCFLYPAKEIWEGYENYRQKQVDLCITSDNVLQDIEMEFPFPAKGEMPVDVVKFAKLCKAVEIMLAEDVVILMEGIFPEMVPNFEFIYETYLRKITHELQSACQCCSESTNSDKQGLLSGLTERASGSRPGSRRGSAFSTNYQGEKEVNLSAYKHCFLAVASVENTVQNVLSQRLDRQATGSKGGSLHNLIKSPSIPVLGHKNSRRPNTKRNSDVAQFVAEGNLPLPFGSGARRLGSQAVNSASGHGLSSQWPWRDEFKSHISKLSTALSERIKQTCEAALSEELLVYQASNVIPTVDLKDELVGGKQDYPRSIAKSCAVIMEKADEVLPLASSHGGKLFHVVRSSFVDSLEASLKTYLSRLTELLSDFPKLCSVDCLYTVTSTAVFIRNQLMNYEEVIGSDPRRPFPLLHRQFSELVGSVSDQIVSYHDTVISTVVLQDAHGHNWRDQRPFYEDERCSFSVQMWNYHLQGLHYDLWSHCPPDKAQDMFTSILHGSLVALTSRYSRAAPSSRRVKQFRSDITAILSTTLSFMWSCCKSITNLLDSGCTVPPFPAIHSLCCCLLTTLARKKERNTVETRRRQIQTLQRLEFRLLMPPLVRYFVQLRTTVVSCPLEVLYSHVTTDRSGEQTVRELTLKTAWLSWVYPEVFKNHEGSLAALPDRQATYVLFKLVVNQPTPHWPLLLRALLSRNARLPMTIVKYGDLNSLRSSEQYHTSGTVLPVAATWFEEGLSSDSDNSKLNEGLICSLYHILFQCSNESSGLVSFLMAQVSREDSWKLFDAASPGLKISCAIESPVWLDCVYRTFDPYIFRFLYPSLLLLCEQDKKVTKAYNFTSMSALPCGCPRKKSPKTRENRNQTEVLYSALKDLLNQLTRHLCAIPKIICQFLNKLQELLHQKSIDLSCKTAGIKVLASLLYRWLMDKDNLYSVCETQLSSDTQRTMAVFADVVWHVLVNLGLSEGGVRDHTLPSEVDALLISKRDWLNQKVEQVKAHIFSQVYEEYQVETVHESVAELQFTHMASALMRDSKGAAALRHAYNFIRTNKDWLMNLVLVPGHILPPEPGHSVPGSKQSSAFNPLKRYDMIGECAFNQDKLASFPYDWDRLLQSGLGTPPDTVKRLAFNRSEMQDGAFLDDSEKELVDSLKGHYGVTVGGGDVAQESD